MFRVFFFVMLGEHCTVAETKRYNCYYELKLYTYLCLTLIIATKLHCSLFFQHKTKRFSKITHTDARNNKNKLCTT